MYLHKAELSAILPSKFDNNLLRKGLAPPVDQKF